MFEWKLTFCIINKGTCIQNMFQGGISVAVNDLAIGFHDSLELYVPIYKRKKL